MKSRAESVQWHIQGVPVCTPQQDPILSFLHMFPTKNAHVGGWCPPTGNPGCAAGVDGFPNKT